MALSTEELKSRLATQQWTAHNIRLNDEVSTMPGKHSLIESDTRLKAVVRVLRMLWGSDFSGLRLADMGCLEGGFSLALALLGAAVTGVEARTINIDKARLLQDHFNLPNLQFVQADVKNFGEGEQYDAILALGILYHLDEPARWLKHLAGITGRVLIIDTHFAPADDADMATIDPRLSLSELETRDAGGWVSKGRWYTEYPADTDPEPQVWASWSNNRSFWLTRESLFLALQHAGFSLIFEQHDYSAGMFEHFNRVFPRCMVVALKGE